MPSLPRYWRRTIILSVLIFGLALWFVLIRGTSPSPATGLSASATFAAIRATEYAPHPTPTPTPLPTITDWKTMTTFTGSGNLHTATFAVPIQWRIEWQCHGYSDGTAGVFGALPHDAHGSLIRDFASSACKARGVTDGHQNEIGVGLYWLEIIAGGAGWTASIQIPK